MRKLFTLLHRWVGLLAGLLLVLLGLTGSLMVWQASLDAALNPGWFRAPAQACTATSQPVARTLALLAEHVPGARAQTVVAPREPGAAYLVWEPRRPDTGWRTEHFIDPHCGRYLGSRERGAIRFDAAHAVPMLYELHKHLLGGDTGHIVVGVAGLLLAGLTLTGLWLSWPRTAGPRLKAWGQALRVRWQGPPARRWYELHRASGLWLLPVALVVSLTGAALVFPNPTRDGVAAVLPLQRLAKLPKTTSGAATAPSLGPDAWVEAAQQEFPAARWSRLTLAGNGPVEVRLLQPGELRASTGNTRVRLDRQGRVLERYDPLAAPAGNQLVDSFFPLHSGEALGLAARLLWTAFGLLPAALLATGAWLWWRRRQRRAAQPRSSLDGAVTM
ncbi:MAG: PepSY-associated TM helix domain-containing protein [Roseateles sp.]